MLTYSFDDRGEESLYSHLYSCIKADIEGGGIAAGEKMPSKRSFARHLGVSLVTVESAYRQLVAEGYLRTEPRRGYFACDVGAPLPSASAVHDFASKGQGAKSSGKGHCACAIDLTGSSFPSGVFPYASWAKTVREALSLEDERELIGETDPFGLLRLRCAIAEHLKGFRGMEVDPECIVVGAGSQVLYNWLVQLLGRDRAYALEDPGYPRLARIYEANSVSLRYLPLDGSGVCADALRASDASVLHLMPSHQYPTGIVTSIGRRYELLGWACEKRGRYLIEDDYDCEFRLQGKAIPSLESIDAAGRVVYANTFAKSLGPAFRVGYMVLPEALAMRFRDEFGFYSNTVSAVDQLALARFIENGSYERHVNRMRTHYRGVRDAFVAAARMCSFSDGMSIEQADEGLHFLMGFPIGERKDRRWGRRFVEAAAEEGVRISALSSFCLGEGSLAALAPDRCRFVVSIAGLDEGKAVAAANALDRAYGRIA